MLAKFDIEIVHKKGKLHTLPDASSRMPQIHHMSVITMQGRIEEIRQAQENDAVVRQLRDKWKVDKRLTDYTSCVMGYYGVNIR